MASWSPREASEPSVPETTESTAPAMERVVPESEHAKTETFLDKAVPSMETGFQKMLNPMLADMERNVAKSTEVLDRIQQQMEAERKARLKKRLSSHIPEALQGGGESGDSVLTKVEQLIFFEEVEGTDEVVLQFEDSCVMYHDDEREGLVRICRLALYHRYPKYATDGFDALYSRPPVIYLSAAARPGLGHYLCLQLGLPLSCICTVPCNTVFGASSKMDVAMLEKLIQDDVAAAKTPVLLLAFAGTPVVGHVDNIQRLQEICKQHNIWLHVEGTYLATLTLFSVPTEVSRAKSGDSLTISPSVWFGIPGLPHATLFKTSDATLTHAAGLNTFNTALKLNCLPIWMSLLTIGHEGIVKRVTFACDLAKLLYDKLDTITTIKQISREKKSTSQRQYKSVAELITKAISALLVFEMVSPTVVFRYGEDTAGPGKVVAPYAVKGEEVEEEDDSDCLYYDALNIWLAEALQASDPKVSIETVEVEREGVCIRYCPIESAPVKGTTKDDVEHFVESLISNLSVLNASTLQRKRFQAIVESQPNLTLVHLHNWAGLGAVSYIPDVYLGRDDLEERDQININNLNAEVVHQLKAKDTAFSIGQAEDGRVCVKFGLITQETDVEELVQLVQTTGREVEESSKFLETMSEMIRKGIEEANKELQKESETKLMHEGVLRQVPMVGSLLNWFSPIKEEVKGRSFNLTSGKIVSTQDTYKYHMQIQEEAGRAQSNSPRVSTSTPPTTPRDGAPAEGRRASEGASTTAGQVRTQLVSQSSPPESPAPGAGPATTPVLFPQGGQGQGDNAGSPAAPVTSAS
ncbi:hypothetical protein BaRGS_00015965 [Batillaria attramentaria]|uniref:Pyridoxal-dependent decarboxylase domain-containing protein 1 n=1 Tax=Batillaria attramentaria TaxID=370345 RepID=A0ABD0L066_9CAEN